MNSLEFINQEIKFLEDMINMDLALIEDEEDLKEIAKKQERLKHLQQIKTELEEYKKLKDKATPKKRIFVDATPSISAHDECPVCRVKVSPIRHYCDNCGQRLE